MSSVLVWKSYLHSSSDSVVLWFLVLWRGWQILESQLLRMCLGLGIHVQKCPARRLLLFKSRDILDWIERLWLFMIYILCSHIHYLWYLNIYICTYIIHIYVYRYIDIYTWTTLFSSRFPSWSTCRCKNIQRYAKKWRISIQIEVIPKKLS